MCQVLFLQGPVMQPLLEQHFQSLVSEFQSSLLSLQPPNRIKRILINFMQTL
jgi:hypothetical protein